MKPHTRKTCPSRILQLALQLLLSSLSNPHSNLRPSLPAWSKVFSPPLHSNSSHSRLAKTLTRLRQKTLQQSKGQAGQAPRQNLLPLQVEPGGVPEASGI